MYIFLANRNLVVYLNNYRAGMGTAEQILLGVTVQHEGVGSNEEIYYFVVFVHNRKSWFFYGSGTGKQIRP
jgi:hypothetical protein